TFFCFSDYMRPAVRLAALNDLPVVMVWTHDSVGLGEDGPTHQPVEHLMALRVIPKFTVIRPADANEAVEAWKIAMQHRSGPVGLVLTRQKVPVFDRSVFAPAAGLARGAYVMADAAGKRPALVLIASGSEVALAISARERLEAEGIPTRVVSMPSFELFDAQDAGYRHQVIPPDLKARVAIEAGATLGWWKYVGEAGAVVGLDRFGASAPGDQVMRELGLSVENVVGQAKAVLARLQG
ncbi:MAG: transketolase, partial [Cyanobacteria bacterium REEB65]|nr:transketolase [Cyanobacteria bacterium REEB65]